MPACIALDENVAHLSNGRISYVIELLDGSYLLHRYFGQALRRYGGSARSRYYKRDYSIELSCSLPHATVDDLPFEYPVGGRGDYRLSACNIRQQNGSGVVEPKFVSWRVLPDKPALRGLPSTYADKGASQTLEVVCEDECAALRIRLYFTVFEDVDVVARSQRFENIGVQRLTIENAQSASLELSPSNYEVVSLYGTHAKEACLSRTDLHHGEQRICSRCGSSSPFYQPFIALCEQGSGKNSGKVWAAALCYSGNFNAQAEMDAFGSARLQMGINAENFSWTLDPGEDFFTPEALLVFSGEGLGGMSAAFHAAVRNHLLPRRFAHRARPVLLNTWESMYYDVSLDKLARQAQLAQQVGIELLVLDDGWFRADNSSRSSMGDWSCNLNKLPGGIEAAAEIVHGEGLQFGLWFEPEAVCKSSALFAEHPEWTLQAPGYAPREGRHEYLLDLGRADVRDHLFAILDGYVASAHIDYIKWDMNRPLCDVWSDALGAHRQPEVAHRYVLGLYDLLHRVTSAHPKLLLETCSSGSARFDLGMLAYAAQNWGSDNTDADDRIDIQNGLSLVYPPEVIGAHVSASPNHRTGRCASLLTRFEVARHFNLGYEFDLSTLDAGALDEVAKQVDSYCSERFWMTDAALWRLETHNESHAAWCSVSQDGSHARLTIVQRRYNQLDCHVTVCLAGLDGSSDYRCCETGEVFGGDELMSAGLAVPLVQGDLQSFSFSFERLA